jgi:hypothetical protein
MNGGDQWQVIDVVIVTYIVDQMCVFSLQA